MLVVNVGHGVVALSRVKEGGGCTDIGSIVTDTCGVGYNLL